MCLLQTQHTLDPCLCVVQQIWFEILLFSVLKVHFWILYSFLPLVLFILASFSDITKNQNWWLIEDIDCQEVRRRWHIWTRLKQWYNWTHGVPVSLHSLYWLTNESLYSYSFLFFLHLLGTYDLWLEYSVSKLKILKLCWCVQQFCGRRCCRIGTDISIVRSFLVFRTNNSESIYCIYLLNFDTCKLYLFSCTY